MSETGHQTLWSRICTKSFIAKMKKEIMQIRDSSRNQMISTREKSTQMSIGVYSFHLLSEYPKTSSSLRNRLFSTLSLIPQLYWQFPFLLGKRVDKLFVFHEVFMKQVSWGSLKPKVQGKFPKNPQVPKNRTFRRAKQWDSEEAAKPLSWEMWRMDKEAKSFCSLIQTFYLLNRSALPRG